MHKNKYQIIIPEQAGDVKIQYHVETGEDIIYVRVHMKNEKQTVYPKITCKIIVPACDVHYLWNSKIHLIKALNLDWFQGLKKTNGFTGAPVQCLLGQDNKNKATMAISDTLNTFTYTVVPIEETGEYAFEVTMFAEEEYREAAYEVAFRVDFKAKAYYDVLSDVSKWWEEEKMNYPAFVPEQAKMPMYSTWYSYHQILDETELVEQCRQAKEYGCSCLLLDDGWQTEDGNRGYAYCGDWENAPSKFSDMRRFVDRLHAFDMKIMTWYSVPFIGERSRNFLKYSDMLIDPKSDREWHVLDPRYPEVREFIITTYEKALKEWDFDGFKLDFVDEFVVTPFSGKEINERRDFESFVEATDCLMKNCTKRLRELKPNILIEFRQTYNGPLMRSYGNIFRAVDCPFDSLENHIRVTDVRILAGDSAVHSDMLMWNIEDSVESAALQIIQVMFSVPQISMKFETLKSEHKKMLHFYMKLWNYFRNAFINGSFEPLNPFCGYNVVKGSFQNQMACTYHSSEIIQIEKLFDEMVFVNGTGNDGLYIKTHNLEGHYDVKVYDCTGEIKEETEVKLSNTGIIAIALPRSGVAVFRARNLNRENEKESFY